MNIDKLNPWNWFKHENQQSTQVPVAQDKAKGSNSFDAAPLMQLHQEMDRLFDDTWRSFGLRPRPTLNRQPSLFNRELVEDNIMGQLQAHMDISGNDHEYVVTVNVPGLTEKDINIEVIGNMLKIEGKKEDAAESKDKHYYCMERSLGTFQRTLSLPEDAQSSDIMANMKNGVLDIHLPRKEVAKEDVKRVQISS